MISGKTQFHGKYLTGLGQRQRWDEFVSGHPEGHLLQSYGWGEFKSRHLWNPIRVIITEPGKEKILAGAQVLFRNMTGLSVAYIPRGPVVDWNDRALTDCLFQTIRSLTRRRRSIYLKIEPNRPYDPAFQMYLMQDLGFRPSTEKVQPINTIRVDLSPEPAKILERMKSKTRYNIGLSERRGVTCRLANPEDPKDFAGFYELMEVTGQRDNFGIHSAHYYRDAWEAFEYGPVDSGRSALLLAEYQEQIIAGVMAFTYGKEAAYLYGASSNDHRREMPTYLLQWKAMLWAKEHGALWYDFWGIPDNIDESEENNAELEQKNVRDGLWGVYRFKQGFGGETYRYPGAYDLVYNRPLYALWLRLQNRRSIV